jgi:hypothetical protein
MPVLIIPSPHDLHFDSTFRGGNAGRDGYYAVRVGYLGLKSLRISERVCMNIVKEPNE